MSLPPPPVQDKPGSFAWLEWYRQLRNYVSESGSVPWYIINFADSNITDIASRSHNNLQTLQGGASGQMYHLDQATYNALISGLALENLEYNVPVDAFSYTIANTTNTLILEPAGTLATGTLTMPASPTNGQRVSVGSTQSITALTHNGNTGQTLKSPLTTIAANGHAGWVYRSTNTTWYRIE